MRSKLEKLVAYLIDERNTHRNGPRFEKPAQHASQEELWQLFRALVNTREPIHASREFYKLQDEVLRELIAADGIATCADATPSPLGPHVFLWRGDITRLKVDAIVNAANSQMLGCWVPGHYCIDNAIHTFAGVELREQCAELMAEQGHEEPTGRAKVTEAFNLPASYIVHTVGPIVQGTPNELQRAQLASCYTSCLDAARAHSCRSIAFCCISTGVFGYPPREAAQLAIDTVASWLDAHDKAEVDVVFDVFGAGDEALYRELLGIQQ